MLDRDAMAGSAAGKPVPLARKALDMVTRKWFGEDAAVHATTEVRSLDAATADSAPGKSATPARPRQSLIKW
jgi:hypothetical protein